MERVPNTIPDPINDNTHISHDFVPDAKWSCGTFEDSGCHENKKVSWAEKQIEKGIHEKEPYGQNKEK
jgi:hypothetical protein